MSTEEHNAWFQRRIADSQETAELTLQAGINEGQIIGPDKKKAWPSKGSLMEKKPKIRGAEYSGES